ncbi:MAG: hypothetical protein R3C26_19070 [Calditrichia bacterium]
MKKRVNSAYLLAACLRTFGIGTKRVDCRNRHGCGIRETLPGVNIIVVGGTMGAAERIDGNYEVRNVPAGIAGFLPILSDINPIR